MMIERLRGLLDREAPGYRTLHHPVASSTQWTAEPVPMLSGCFAKSVIVRLDGEPVMAVVPASRRVDTGLLARAAGAQSACLVAEAKLYDMFHGCAIGAVPPFGHLFGLDVFVDESLILQPEIAFRACSHDEMLQMKTADYLRLAQPEVVSIAADDASKRYVRRSRGSPATPA